MKAKVNAKLEEMRNEGIIEKVQGATPWTPKLISRKVICNLPWPRNHATSLPSPHLMMAHTVSLAL